jgi:hypothetical protein
MRSRADLDDEAPGLGVMRTTRAERDLHRQVLDHRRRLAARVSGAGEGAGGTSAVRRQSDAGCEHKSRQAVSART